MLLELRRCLAEHGGEEPEEEEAAGEWDDGDVGLPSRWAEAVSQLDKASIFRSHRRSAAGSAGASARSAVLLAANTGAAWGLGSMLMRSLALVVGDAEEWALLPLRRSHLDAAPHLWAALSVLCVSFAIASVALVFGAIFEQLGTCKGSWPEVPAAPSSAVDWRLRALGVAAISFASGMGLGVAHPAQSALLLGA